MFHATETVSALATRIDRPVVTTTYFLSASDRATSPLNRLMTHGIKSGQLIFDTSTSTTSTGDGCCGQFASSCAVAIANMAAVPSYHDTDDNCRITHSSTSTTAHLPTAYSWCAVLLSSKQHRQSNSAPAKRIHKF